MFPFVNLHTEGLLGSLGIVSFATSRAHLVCDVQKYEEHLSVKQSLVSFALAFVAVHSEPRSASRATN